MVYVEKLMLVSMEEGVFCNIQSRDSWVQNAQNALHWIANAKLAVICPVEIIIVSSKKTFLS